jgi:hypothetical protein
MSNKKLNDIETFVNILEDSDEHFRVINQDKENHVQFSERKIIFIFDENSKFSKITNIK